MFEIVFVFCVCVINPSNADPTFIKNTRIDIFGKPSKPYHIATHWIALAEYSQMSTHMPGLLLFVHFSHHFVLAKSATSSIGLKK